MSIPDVLSNGVAIPAVGLGTWPLKGEECEAAVREALAAGYRHLDTAAMYANEAEVGRGVAQRGDQQRPERVHVGGGRQRAAGPELGRLVLGICVGHAGPRPRGSMDQEPGVAGVIDKFLKLLDANNLWTRD